MINEEIKQLEVEQQRIIGEVQEIEKQKNARITRLAEIQGVIKYLNSKEEKENGTKHKN